MTWKSFSSLGAIAAGVFFTATHEAAARVIVPSNAVFGESYFLDVFTDSESTLWSLVQYYPDLGGAATLYNNETDSALFQGYHLVNPFPITGTRVGNFLYDYNVGQLTGVEYHMNMKNI